MSNPNFDQYLTTTLNNHRATLIDGVFEARPLAYFLKESQSVKTDGGQKIITPINFSKNGTVGSYAGSDTLDVTPSPGPTSAEYDWKQHAGSIYIEGIEEARNAGKEKIMSLLDFRVKQLKESIIDDWNTQFWADGTGNGGKDFNGLGNLVFQNAAAVGNIDPTAQPGWETKLNPAAGALSEATMRTMYNDLSYGSNTPNVIITSQDQFEKFEALFETRTRYEDEAMANAGFQNITFKGVPVTFDRACPADTMAFLNTQYIEFIMHSETMMRATPFFRPGNQDIRTSNVLTYGELIVTSRRHQGALQGLT